MSLENPTRLQIGMHGNFAGRDFGLVGRVVMGVTVAGETYYWNEFNLEAATGEEATLVFEETEKGDEWRLFTMFEPEYPLTAADAATKQTGDRLNLNGTDVSVTLVSSSRVYRIEGKPPEGLKVGDEANYFNAEAGSAMQVVSWTGEEMEYYNGFTLSRAAVDTAFNLPRQAPSKIFSSLGGGASGSDTGSGNYAGMGKFFLQGGVVIILFFVIFGRSLSCSTSYEATPVKKIYAGPPPLMTGATGKWNEKNFRITAHAVVEMEEVGAVFERNEYELTDDFGQVDLLVCGDKPGAKEWTLFSPLAPLQPPTSQEAAAQKAGDMVNVDGMTATIHDLFQYTVRHTENVAVSGWQMGDVRYGYEGQSEHAALLARWNRDGIGFYRGENISEKGVKVFTAAFTVSSPQ